MTKITLSAARSYDMFTVLASTSPAEHEELKPSEAHKAAYWTDKLKGKFETAASEYSDATSKVMEKVDLRRKSLLDEVENWNKANPDASEKDKDVFKTTKDILLNDLYLQLVKEAGLDELGKKEVEIEFDRESHVDFLKSYCKKFLHKKIRLSSAYLEMMNAIVGEPAE